MIYHETEHGTIYCGDSLDVLRGMADESVDLVLTDPPYGVEGGHGGQLRDYRKTNYTDAFNDTPEYIKQVCVKAIEESLRVGKTVAMTPGTRCLTFYPQPDEVGCFYSPAASRIGKFGFQNCHPIFYYGYYKNAGKGALHTAYVLTERSEKNGHPCPKPIVAWSWLLSRCSEPNNLILDPFAGSGTTAIACINLRRKYILIEKEEKYCEIAVRRIESYLDQTTIDL